MPKTDKEQNKIIIKSHSTLLRAYLLRVKENLRAVSRGKPSEAFWSLTCHPSLFQFIFLNLLLPRECHHFLIFLDECWREESSRIMYHPDIFLSIFATIWWKIATTAKSLFSIDGNITFKCIIFILFGLKVRSSCSVSTYCLFPKMFFAEIEYMSVIRFFFQCTVR